MMESFERANSKEEPPAEEEKKSSLVEAVASPSPAVQKEPPEKTLLQKFN